MAIFGDPTIASPPKSEILIRLLVSGYDAITRAYIIRGMDGRGWGVWGWLPMVAGLVHRYDRLRSLYIIVSMVSL